jgi:hypothetical protein
MGTDPVLDDAIVILETDVAFAKGVTVTLVNPTRDSE